MLLNKQMSHDAIIQERIRQARKSFDLAYFMTAVSAVIGLAGAVLIYAEKVQAGAVTTTGGAVSIVYCLRLAKDANDRLDKLSSDLDDKEDPKV